MGPSITEALAGKRLLITGATGFVGTALLERLLASQPQTRLVLLVRPRGSRSGAQRARDLLGEHAFDPLREQWGSAELAATFARQVEVIEGDFATSELRFPGDLDIVLHCAADVGFDRAIDVAFAVNVVGAQRLYAAVLASGNRPHLVHVSTAYVAGLRRGPVLEEPVRVHANWRDEAAAVAGLRSTADLQSREPAVLARLTRTTRAEVGLANSVGAARATEQARHEWVTARLSESGRVRALSLGFPDVYALTKALGEQVVEEIARQHNLPLSVVRPGITESALAHPYPGWIKGLKMAEPIIHASGRGDLPESPAVPDGALDVLPIDLVTNALLAAAARPPVGGGAVYYHLTSGARNPLRFRDLYELGRHYFNRHPIVEPGGGPIKPPRWVFPGLKSVERRLGLAEWSLDRVDELLDWVPGRSPFVLRLADRAERQARRVHTARRLLDLFGPYVSAEMTYLDAATQRLLASLSAQDRAAFDFDCAHIDWRHYLLDIHLPSVRRELRGRPAVSTSRRPSRMDRATLAVFDLDGTLLQTTVVEAYLWARLHDLPRRRWLAELAEMAARLPGYVVAEHADRAQFLRSVYRKYRGASRPRLEQLVDDEIGPLILERLAPAGIRRVREHRAVGHYTVLLTGALEAFTRPLRPLFDQVEGVRLASHGPRFTGDLDMPPLVGEARLGWLQVLAKARSVDLSDVYVYADSHSDLPLLAAVGHPVVVNPDVRLYRAARRHRWPIEEWRR